MKLLYIINFYGTPPLNYLEKYFRETKSAQLSILKLPSVRPMKARFFSDAFFVNQEGEKRPFNISIPIELPMFLTFFAQYVMNLLFLFYLLISGLLEKYDVVIGETSFGGCIAYLLGKAGRAGYSIYLNGDILPEVRKGTGEPFYLSKSENFPYEILKYIDNLMIKIQRQLRVLAFKCDLIWYPNGKTKNWDKKNGFKIKDSIVSQTVLVDSSQVKKNANLKREKPVLCYIGRLDEFAGVDMSLKVLANLKKKISSVKLVLVGGGSLTVEKYKRVASGLNVLDNTKFHGYVEDMDEALNIIQEAKFGLALYKPSKDNVSLFAEPGKPKEYIKVGIPVVITRGGPAVSQEIEKYSAGIVVDYDPIAISDKLYGILSDTKKYELLKKGVVDFGEKYDYKSKFDFFFNKLGPRLAKKKMMER